MKLTLPPTSPRKVSLSGIPGGVAGTRATLEAMLRVVHDARASQTVLDAVAQLVRFLPQHDQLAEAQAIFNFVQNHIRYTRDPLTVEMLQTPEQLLERGVGDCDDKAILLMAMLHAVGIPAMFVVGGRAPNMFEHVWVAAYLNGQWISMDATEPHAMGWTPNLPYTMHAQLQA